MKPSLRCALLALPVAAACAAGAVWAADPAAKTDKPAVNAPSAGMPAPCSTYAYTCPSGFACTVLQAPPPKMPPATFVAYQCRRTTGEFALLPGQCPPGYIVAPSGVCTPGPKACAEFVKPAWTWTRSTIKLTGTTGYNCPYINSGVANSQ
jgi:hypothetical protein